MPPSIVPGRLLVVVALVAAGVATGWVYGARYELDKAARFEGQVQGLGQAAAQRARRIEARQTLINSETHHAHDAGLDLLHAYYGRLRRPAAGFGTLSVPAFGPGAPGPGSADAGPAAAGIAPRLAEEPREQLAERCAETTLMFLDLRNAWREQSALGVAP